jgi:endonuclease YncB( thermonuclease family)
VHTAGVALGRKAGIEPVERDQYGRLVARVIVRGESLGELLVRDGYAWVYDRYCNRPSCRRLRRLEARAKEEERGLWAEPDPIPPWRWRRGERADSGWRFW